MHYILVKFNDNYGDEFDVQGFRVFSHVDYQEWLIRVTHEFDQNDKSLKAELEVFTPVYPGHQPRVYVEMYFGTNEFLQWSSRADFNTCIETSIITEAERDFLVKQFTEVVETYGWGVFPDFDSYEEELED